MSSKLNELENRWASLDQKVKAQRLSKAAAKWPSTEVGKQIAWEALTREQKIFAAQLLPMVQRTEAHPDSKEDTFRCLDCFDRAYTIMTSENSSNVTWCDCDTGLSAAAGYWFDKTNPMHSGFGRRVRSLSGQRQLEAFILSPLSHDYEFVFKLRKRIDSLIDSERKIRQRRKAEE